MLARVLFQLTSNNNIQREEAIACLTLIHMLELFHSDTVIIIEIPLILLQELPTFIKLNNGLFGHMSQKKNSIICASFEYLPIFDNSLAG